MDDRGQLYLGRKLDDQGHLTPEPLLYPIDHLTTHALLLGMTGSGKTGMGLVIVEEILRQGLPVLLLDVKGDLANLLLTFPDLAPADFLPWVDADAARRQDQTPEQAAAELADRARTGLAEWDLTPDHIARLRQTVDLALYTPGSRSGRPVDLLARFSAPPQNDPDELALRAQGLASALLGLAGVNADPLRSREHILITTLIRYSWEQQGALELPALIRMVQQPPVQQIGVFDLESFYPQKERFDLALTLNNLIAAPGFALWRDGEPLDIARFLWTQATPDNPPRPRACVFYLAHLPEEQRQFFITLFLEELRAWVRQSAGAQTLRALLYFDELYGYLPPYPANPPTKAPLMSLVKQARAAGLGLLLATQNPADLDYKGLGNIGAWIVGALRTERDKSRVLEGMEGVLAESGLDSTTMAQALGRLKSRTFLLHNARAGSVQFFGSRWALSYLRGPLTAAEVRQLAAPTAPALPPAAVMPLPTASPAPTIAAVTPIPQPTPVINYTVQAPAPTPITPPPAPAPVAPPAPTAVDPQIPQVFFPPTFTAARALQRHRETTGQPLPANMQIRMLLQPVLLGIGVIHYFHEKAAVTLTTQQAWKLESAEETWSIGWEQGQLIVARTEDMISQPPEGDYTPLPRSLSQPAAYKRWNQTFKAHLLRSAHLTIWHSPTLDIYSRPDEGKRAFLERCRAEMERRKQAEQQIVRDRFDKQLVRVDDKIHKEELEMEGEEDQLSERKREEFFSGAESVLGFVTGRTRRVFSQASRQRRLVQQLEADIDESVQALKTFRAERKQIEKELAGALDVVARKWDGILEQVREIPIRPRQQDVEIRYCGLAWFPVWELTANGSVPIYLPAYQAL